MSRLLVVLLEDYAHFFRRPMFWVWVVILALTSWGLSTGDMRISSGDATVGGAKAWLTSEFSVAMMLSMVIFIFYMFFIAIASGMAVIRDEDLKVGEVLHATPLRPSEYVWGKLGASVAAFLTVLFIHLILAAFFNHLFPNELADEIRGPFNPRNYLLPAIVFGLPAILFLTGTTFAVGAWLRKPILVFVIPVAVLLVTAFFLWDWSPHWLDPRVNRILMLVDPAGFRWLNETWLKVDRGVAFYNTSPIPYDPIFLLSRLALAGLGIGAVALVQRAVTRRIRGVSSARRKEGPVAAPPAAVEEAAPGTLGAKSGPVGFFAGALLVARFEMRELAGSPGLYLFIPIILLEIVGNALFELGPFDTKILFTSGMLAAAAMNTTTLLVCLLLLFYTVESQERERATGLAPIYYASRAKTGSILLGKTLANGAVGGIILLVAFLACLVVLVVQGDAPIELRPFLVSWGFVLIPTFLLWASFVLAVHALFGNRYTTYALGLGVLILTGYLQMTGRMSWVGNWDAWSVVRWSDFGVFQLNRTPLLLNRILALSLAAFFIALTVRLFERRTRDTTRTVHRLRPASLLRGVLRLAPFFVVPLALGIALVVQVENGFQGKEAKKKARDYWKANLATYKDAPLPAIASVDLDLELFPKERHLETKGTFELFNHLDHPLRKIPLTAGLGWTELEWTLNGAPTEPENRGGLFVFSPDLLPGDRATIGWSAKSRVPAGATKNGGGTDEFVLPMAVVLTSFTPSFVPVLGYVEEIGVEEENQLQSRDYPDDFFEGITHSAFGSDVPFPVTTRVTLPEAYRAHGVGTCIEETVADGKRTAVWRSDHPVSFFNVAAGKWEVRRGEGTAIYYHPKHAYNLDEMIEALDGARRYFSEWFYPFPWAELKVSEFPALAGYAQGFPTNITFSEGIGFLTKSDPRSNAAFMVTTHEAAHQWWGNILLPGKGPGGDILSEGMAHFSTILLFDQIKGERSRIGFCKGIEEKYGEDRQADSERPLVKIDGTRPGDRTVTYDKGGWVFWMLLNHMGREQGLAGYSDFIHRYSPGPDHALLQDLVAVLREHAADTTAYDAFVKQWFFEVVLPEYAIRDPERRALEDGRWEVTARVENIGTGTAEINVAALRGERFPEKPEESEESDTFRRAGTSVVLGAGESAEVQIRCDFEPDRLEVDPDALVLMLARDRALARF